MDTNKGFTAIEMMVGLALVGIVATIGLVNYTRQIPRYQLREAGRDLAAQLRLLRQMAITEGGTRQISFETDDDENAYEFGDDGEQHLPSHVRFGVMEGIDENTYGETNLPDDGISFAGQTASFQSDGLPVNAGAIYLTNAPYRNEAVAISVNLTGRVKLFKWDGDEWQ